MPLLHWLTRDEDIHAATQTPYRLLEQVAEHSHGDPDTGNMLVQGDNLDALKALLPYYAGKVKCIFIDPPYNTRSAFDHYDDNLEHAKWLALIYPRLELLRGLLAEDGSIWVTIDDNEGHYLKVIMDEVFGRANFINTISVNMKHIAGASGGGEDKRLKKNIEYIHAYAKNYALLPQFRNAYDYIPIIDLVESYREEGKSWKYTTALIYEGEKSYLGSTVDGDGNEIKIYQRRNPIMKSINKIIREENISEELAYAKYADKLFQTAMPQSSIRPRVMEKAIELGSREDLHSIEYVPRSGKNRGVLYEQFYKGESFRLFAWLRDVTEEKNGVLYKKELQGTYWNYASETKNLTKEGSVQFPNGKKPEALISRIIEMTTQDGDLVLDSFLGSGTTAAVAHKMERRYIGIEMGDHATTHCVPRLQKVIEGEQGGISNAVGWQGGGGFCFYKIGMPVFDENGHISTSIRFAPLAAHLWFASTGIPYKGNATSPFLGEHEGVGFYLLYNGILGDQSADGGNVLTGRILSSLPNHDGQKVIFGESCRLSAERLQAERIIFRQIPYEIKAR